MSYTFTEHTANGTQVTFPFRFSGSDKGYLRTSDILVERKEGNKWVTATGWSISGTHQITFRVPPSSGTLLRIRRVVDKEKNYAEFDRNVMLDMKSLNGSFIHLLEIAQELLDGFYPEGYYVKQDVNWGDNKIINLGDGTEPKDAVNKGQLDKVDKTQTEWNQQQDVLIDGLRRALTSSVAHRTIPWLYTAKGGETELRPPYDFESALVFINGVFQHEISGAYLIRDNKIILAERLLRDDEVYLLIGSRVASPDRSSWVYFNRNVEEGQTKVKTGTKFSSVEVYLDGLYQPEDVYTVEDDTIIFSEPLPACRVTGKLKIA
ncbi:tail protein/adaptor protein [Proteus phage vB_PmiP_Pm5460]|uniref:Tail protein/adaptor protein n=1 Tax=Proteus phage vB_PmiP_Pm5460 TaxID=1636249 RepID=A0A0G2SSE8_9CAUD|nr:tail fiber protein [Proteus phage vB_PmiP_Pm5460]AKA61851.1 tail protein/adaptor protein [Proteus phage vB_PmiP_Pm5460]